ncbi:MAG: two-component sensor histidine kinase, partial [Lachnospiraceae bacterium]|nr:two-component sensor histidine kinase [Lachnospiraceae bacterium]
MRYSIRKQFALVFGLLMAGTILLCWFINNTFLENYYLNNKKKAMLSAYHIVNKASNEGTINAEDFDIEFQQICGKNNIDIILLDTQTRTIKTSVNNYETLSRQLLDYLFKKGESRHDRVLAEEENYEMHIELDTRTWFEYVDMWG